LKKGSVLDMDRAEETPPMNELAPFLLLASLCIPALAAGDSAPGNGSGETALHWAAMEGDAKAVRALLDRGARIDAVNELGQTPLFLACGQSRRQMKAQARVVALLLDRGAAVNAVDNSGETPLHLAAARENTDIVKILLDRGAKPDVADGSEMTPLMWAAAGDGGEQIVRMLLERGARANAANRNNQTPLLLALVNDRAATAALLRAKGGR
jgi:ankyrin repeat protein